MNRQKSSKKPVIILVAVIAIIALVYFYYTGSVPSISGTLLQSNPSSDSPVGAEVLALLNQIQSLKIDTSLFKDPGYQTLQDHTVMIPTQNVGRPNPFAPVPGMSAQGTAPSPGH